MDARFFSTIHRYSGKHKLLDYFGIFCAELLPFLMAGIVGMITIWPWQLYNWTVFVQVIVSLLIASGVARILKKIFGTQRPPVVTSVKSTPLVETNVIHAFPSGHSAVAFAIATSVLLGTNIALGITFLAAATIVAIGRVFVGVHWPSDIIGGSIVGVITSVCVYFVQQALF